MSEPESLIPDLLGDVLVTKQRVVYHQIQEALRQSKNMLSVDVSAVDGMFDKIAHMRRRELVAEEEIRQLRAANDELVQSQQELITLVEGMARLLGTVSRK